MLKKRGIYSNYLHHVIASVNINCLNVNYNCESVECAEDVFGVTLNCWFFQVNGWLGWTVFQLSSSNLILRSQ
jgi:hypothetical protein